MTLLEAALVPGTITHREGGGAWFVTGPVGSGKTWCLDEVAGSESHRTVHRLRAAGVGTGGRGLGVALTPPVDAATVADLVDAVAGAVVLLDDIDELDDEALSAAEALAARSRDTGTIVVMTEGTGRGRPATAAVAVHAELLSLGPLDPLRPTYRALVGELDDLPPPPDEADAPGLHSETGGWYELVAVHPQVAGAGADRALIGPRLATLAAADRRCAVMLAFGVSLDDGSLERLTDLRGDELDAALARLEAAGVLHGGRMAPIVAGAIRQLSSPGERRATLDAITARGAGPTLVAVAQWVVGSEDRSPEAAAAMVAGARHLPASQAAPLLEAAVGAGAGGEAVDAWIEALLTLGEPGRALAVAVEHGAHEPTLQVCLARAGRVIDACRVGAASPVYEALVAAGAGEARRAAALLAELAPAVVGAEAAMAALARAGVALVDGGDDAARLAREAQRLSDDVGDCGTWPLDPRSCVELALAATLGEAPASSEGAAHDASSAFGELNVAVAAWSAARAGRLSEARIEEPQSDPVAAAVAGVVAAALALRADDLERLPPSVERAMRLLERVQVDAWRFPVLVDLLAPAARAGVGVAELETRAAAVLESCRPSSPLRLAYAAARLWAEVSGGDESRVAEAVAAFDDIDGSSAAHELYAEVVPVVGDVFAGSVDADAVLAAAAALRDAGLVFDAGRLTGAAALRTRDERQAKTLLKESRAMRQERRASTRTSGDVTELSDREVEVARLVVQGRTHKEVGASLFISAKTVEHHVARIRNKLGVRTRAEMMSAIKDYLDSSVDLA